MKECDLKYLYGHSLSIASSIFLFTLEGLKNCTAVEAESIRVTNFKKRDPLLPLYTCFVFILLSVWSLSSGRCNIIL